MQYSALSPPLLDPSRSLYMFLCGDPSLETISLLHRALQHFTTPFYFAEISIGTPPQKFKMMVDIGISMTMVSAKDCSGCPSGSPFDGHPASHTFANKSTASIDFSYLGGKIEGFISDDTVAVGSLSVAKGEFRRPLQRRYGRRLSPPTEPPHLRWAFWLSRDLAADNGSEQESVGEFTFGGVNSSLYSGDIEFLSLAAGSAALGSWTLEISAITVGTKAVSITPNATLAMFDSTFDSISGPDAESDIQRNVYSVFRETPPSIGFAQLSTIAGGTGTPNATASTGGSSSAGSSSSSTSSSPGSTASTSTDIALKTKSNTAAASSSTAGAEKDEQAQQTTTSLRSTAMWRQRPQGPLNLLLSAALMSMKRAQIEAVNLSSEASNYLVQTAEGLHLYPGTSSHLNESSHSASPPESSADPAILQELQTLRHEVRWLTQRAGDEPPPIYM
ncbi:aspartic peptidase domain-containing protein [Mycena olivaceomarginata]|nr:aspartic peptidase domain-containing protein [Mycena olivaceomarginata]